MIKEAYCSREVAELFKKVFPDAHLIAIASDTEGVYDTLTHQAAVRWLRERKNIHLTTTVGLVGKDKVLTYFWCPVINVGSYLDYPISYPDGSLDSPAPTYEEAVERYLKTMLTKLVDNA